MQAFEAYIEDNNFYPIGQTINIGKRKKAIITILDEPVESLKEEKKPVRPPFQFNRLAGKIWISDDFDEEMDEYGRFKSEPDFGKPVKELWED